MSATTILAAGSTNTPRSVLRFAPALTLGVLVLPIGAGLIGTLLPAFGVLPAIGRDELDLSAWRALFAHPGFATSLRLTVVTGVAATVIAVVLTLALAAALQGRAWAQRIGAVIAPLMATPHAALAIGLAFLISPSGWIVRLVSPGLTGWDVPPDVLTVGHPSGWPIVASLLLKEVPYLLLMTLGALNQVPAQQRLAIARSLGYTQSLAWLKVVLPSVYPQIRLPIYAVLAYSLSNVEVALILGPGNPPTLAVLAVRWFSDPDVAMALPAAAAATLVLVLAGGGVALWRCGERAAVALGRRWLEAGRRSATPLVVRCAPTLGAVLLAAALAAVLALALWSIAQQWRFPSALPQAWTTANWQRQSTSLAGPTLATLRIGFIATTIALLLTLACLENEARAGRPRGHANASGASPRLLYLPLLVPQVAFLFGAQVLLVRLGLDATHYAVIWAHLIYVLPYVYLSLAEPWRAFDPRYERTALALGRSRARAFFSIKLPMLLLPMLIAGAIGFAVSVGQYLPTLFAGSGRVATLTTEAVTLASGADRRVIGVWAILQAALPLAAYVLALALPPLLFLNRRGVGR